MVRAENLHRVKRKSVFIPPAHGLTQKAVDNFFTALDALRAAHGLSVGSLCRASGVDRSNYYRLQQGGRVRATTVAKLQAGLARLLSLAASQEASPVEARVPHAQLHDKHVLYRAYFVRACAVFGQCPAVMDAQLARSGAVTRDPLWLTACRLRRIALYAVVVGCGVSGAVLARSMTPPLSKQAVSRALRDVEDEREDAGFDALLRTILQTTLGASLSASRLPTPNVVQEEV